MTKFGSPDPVPGIERIVTKVNYLDARLVAARAASCRRPEQAREYVRERVCKLRYL